MTLSHFGFGSPHSNAVGDQVAQNLIHRALLRWIRCKIAIRAMSLQQPLALQKAGHALSNGRHIQKMPYASRITADRLDQLCRADIPGFAWPRRELALRHQTSR